MITKYTKYIKYLKFKNSDELGQNSFYAGTFFLGSALPISIIFYLISIFIIIVKYSSYSYVEV